MKKREQKKRDEKRRLEQRRLQPKRRVEHVLAALGRAQLARLDEMLARRRAVRETYREAFAGLAPVFQGDDDAADNCWLTAILVEDPIGLAGELARQDVETRVLWKPMHRQPVFAGCRTALTGAADALFERGLALPSGSGLSDAEIGRVVALVSRCVA